MKHMIILLLFSLPFLESCMEEKGTYDYKTINEITIDSLVGEDGQKITTFTVELLQDIVFKPHLSQSNYSDGDEENLAYCWYIYSLLDAKADTISKEKDLYWKVSKPAGSYRMRFMATDKNTGIFSRYDFTINVDTKLTGGYLILSEKENHPYLSLLNTAGNVIPNIYENSNGGQSMVGKPISITNAVVPQGPLFQKNLVVLTNNGGYNLSAIDFGLLGDYKDLFFLEPQNSDPYAYYKASSGSTLVRWSFIIDNGKLYPREDWYSSYAYTEGNNYEKTKFLAPYPGTYEMSKYAIVTGSAHVFYDNNNMRFWKVGVASISIANQLSSINNNADSSAIVAFNPDSVGLQLVYMDQGKDNMSYALMKNEKDNINYILKFNVYSNNYSGKYVSYWKKPIGADAISHGIMEASSYAMSKCDAYLYYNHENTVYRYDLEYDIDVPIVNTDTIQPGSVVDYVYLRNNGYSTSTFYGLNLFIGISQKGTGENGLDGSLLNYQLTRSGEVDSLIMNYPNIAGKIVSMDYK